MAALAETHCAQIAAILEAWGMPRTNAERTAEVMTWADLRGVASHGMLLNYDVLRAKVGSEPDDRSDARQGAREGQQHRPFLHGARSGSVPRPVDFRRDVLTFIGALRATKPVDPAEPVLVAGEPERMKVAKHSIEGIDVPKGLSRKLRAIANEAGAPWVLALA